MHALLQPGHVPCTAPRLQAGPPSALQPRSLKPRRLQHRAGVPPLGRALNAAPSSTELDHSLHTQQSSSRNEQLQGTQQGDGAVLATQAEDTIAAIVTVAQSSLYGARVHEQPGSVAQGTVSIIRVSGSEAVEVAKKLFRPGGKVKPGWEPQSHRVHYGTVEDMQGKRLDEVLLLCMRSPRSYTREDVIELHVHGGGVCAARVLQACLEAGARRAQPGEFTLRAFLNGRLDLTQAEAVSELLQARTTGAADSALAGLEGGVGSAVRELRAQVLSLIAELEARLDFDEDLPEMDVQRLQNQVESLQEGIESALRTARTGTLLRSGITVAIVGRPNVGKSSLLNAWSLSERAIVTDVAGTTRDVVEAGLVVGGVPLTLLDTAGMRESTDKVERLGVERSRAAAANADIVIMVVDAQAGWTEEDAEIYKALWGEGPGTQSCAVKGLSLLVANKSDLATVQQQQQQQQWQQQQEEQQEQRQGTQRAPEKQPQESNVRPSSAMEAALSASQARRQQQQQQQQQLGLRLPLMCQKTFARIVGTSAINSVGLEDLGTAILDLAGAPQLAQGGASWAVNERQAEALVRAHEALMKTNESVASGLPIDFWTIDLRSALLALGEVSGDEVTEEVLDNIFSRFCIGK